MAVGDTRSSNFFDFIVDRDTERCIECLVCIQQCPYDANIH
ncbi:MAG: 4Fe-4S binding protein, partial [Nitrospirota bacterium]